ncbi:M20/M25/M40 family metallo-hydrolase [Extibacter muris]|uniref:M20/M25/M40 family metallo-hydrolase n=1 Tax=Extibacter muris TaxID=1796622 RepID=UPI001D092AA1|nr:M20/M25/M40 family metallo-hydrolase [Extibacter muris]MCB6202073.1 M20/M25/M40 family metallo-hydrolase [Extibacter muris]MCQ4665698.1 M20/M25/M40 family metallo-hydrolase [Extibacter muris]MCQ4693142.1 M20/M25/M40 family metallo-hydrolase [Extibacter muris]
MVDEVLRQFRALCAIPRATFHEEACAEYIARKGLEYGCKVVRDGKNNVMLEKGAHPGYGHRPLLILQAHMDMVCKKEPGHEYDPLRDGIRLIEEEGKITADGTTLGADNGIGVAVILEILRGAVPCGPVRGIFTVEEEQGMGGAKNLDASWLQGTYFISLDWTSTRTSCIGCAASRSIRVKKNLRWRPPKHDTAFRLKLVGLPGGHSGLDIGHVRRNAICEMVQILQNIQLLGVNIELAGIEGGTAGNVIPDSCMCTVSATLDKEEELKELIAVMDGQLNADSQLAKESVHLTADRVRQPGKVLERKCMKEMLDFIQSVPDGVLKPLPYEGGLVQLSANTGKVSVEEDLDLVIMARGNEEQLLDAYYSRIQYQALRYHMIPEQISREPGFASAPDGKLIRKVCGIYKAQNKEELIPEAVHAGLECGYFKQKNPGLELIVLGADLKDIHTTGETLYTERLRLLCSLLEELLGTIE